MIESITSNREPQPQFEAMYIVMSTSQNVDRVIRDFSNGQQQYAAAHLFFVDGTCLLSILAPPGASTYGTAASAHELRIQVSVQTPRVPPTIQAVRL